MKLCLFGFVALCFYFSDISPNTGIISEKKNPVNVPYGISEKGQIKFSNTASVLKKLHNSSELLSSDFHNLAGFSETIEEWGITEEGFERLFWDGLTESLKFYQSVPHLNQSAVNLLIQTELQGNSDLGHSLERPEINTASLSIAFDALNQFSGEWHGRWQSMKVHHLWLPVKEHREGVTSKYSLAGVQSCFTGDGFGWNYVVKSNDGIAILGFVCHVTKDGIISEKVPHYAFVNPGRELTWVTEDHIYYEFVCDHSVCGKEKHYVITGARYKTGSKKVKLASGFQAIYLPNNRRTPKFKSFSLDKHKQKKPSSWFPKIPNPSQVMIALAMPLRSFFPEVKSPAWPFIQFILQIKK